MTGWEPTPLGYHPDAKDLTPQWFLLTILVAMLVIVMDLFTTKFFFSGSMILVVSGKEFGNAFFNQKQGIRRSALIFGSIFLVMGLLLLVWPQ